MGLALISFSDKVAAL